MLIEVKVPQLSESVAEATLLAWHKKQGEAVKRDENLIDIETDKVVLELPAPADGVLVSILKGDKGTVVAGEVIAKIDTEGKASAVSSQKDEVKKEEPKAKPAATPAVMPSAQKIAAEKGIDTSKVQGTGRDGRVTKGDVLAQPEKTSVQRAALQQPPAQVNTEKLLAGRPEQRVPMSRLRARVAERLVQSQSTAAILTTFNEVNMAPVMALRKNYQERFEKEHGVKLGFMSFFVKAAVHALKKYPVVNASIDGSDIVYHGYFDIGVAVGSPRG
ncbi:MAG TPA: 2-oxo acid dehydrogenase subunit E2, partial [Burkholderiales bacterium]